MQIYFTYKRYHLLVQSAAATRDAVMKSNNGGRMAEVFSQVTSAYRIQSCPCLPVRHQLIEVTNRGKAVQLT